MSPLIKHPAIRLALFAAIALVACWPYLSTAGAQNDFRDAQVLDHYESTARRTLLDYGQLPLWNPYSCGGLYALGSPQTRFASPTFLATVAFGTNRGEAIVHWLLVLLALEGTYRCLRSHRVAHRAALLAAPVFGISGIFACAPFLGWVSFCGFAALPWAVWGTQQALRGRSWGLFIAAACVAFMAGFGGTYTVPITALACGAEFIGPLKRKRFEHVARVAAALVLATLGFSAFRLLPIWETLRHAPRTVASLESHSLPQITGLLFGTGMPFDGHECWYLIGLPAALLAALELLRRRSIWLAAALVTCVWLAMGHGATPSLFAMFRQVPLLDMLRSPERFLVLAGLIIAVGAGRALTSLFARARTSKRWAHAALLATVALVVNSTFQIANFDAAARLRSLVRAPVEVQQPFHQARGNRWAVGEIGALNRGSLSCWEAYPVPQSRLLRGDLTEEAALENQSAGRLEHTQWSPNTMTYRLSVQQPTRLLVNQNFHPGWHASSGTVISQQGLLGVDVPTGDYELTLSFRPRSAVVGITVSLLSLIVLIAISRGSLARFHVVALAAPLIIGVVLFNAINEPWPEYVPLDAEGAPVLVDAPPPNTTMLEIDFEGGVRLQAASAERISNNRIRLELDWVVPQRAASTLGIFVHFEPEGGKGFNGDHPSVSEALTFHELPIGKTARDVMLISVPAEARDKPLTVWAGVWALRGDGKRQRVLSVTPVPVNADRVQVAKLSSP